MQITINGAKLCNISLIILMLPNILFAAGWMSGGYAILYSIVIIVGMVYACLIIQKNVKDNIVISLGGLCLLIIGASVIIWISGIGGCFPQGQDWYLRNAIYRDLINYEWPVVYTETGYGLCYYIGFWLVPASLTKVFGLMGCGEWLLLNIGDFLLYLWSLLCLICVFLLILLMVCQRAKNDCKSSLLLLAVFVSYGGFSIIGEKLAETLGVVSDLSRLNGWYIEHWSVNIFIMNSNATMLMNVFNQLLPAWIATLLFVILKRRYEMFGLIGFSICISAPFPMVGIGSLMIGMFLWNVYRERKLQLKRLFSISNICSLFMLAVTGLYFVGSGSGSIGIRNIWVPVGGVHPLVWLLLVVLLTFGVWSIAVFIMQRSYFIVYVSVVIVLLSLISIADTADFAMRATIPAYFIIMLSVFQCLYGSVRSGIGEKVKKCIPIMLTVSVMSVWICFMNLCGEAVTAKTLVKPFIVENCYSLEGMTDTVDYRLLHQYTKNNLNTDFFFDVLCDNDSVCEYPVIHKVLDASGEIRISSVEMQHSQTEWVLALIAEKDRMNAIEQIELQLQNDKRGVVNFEEPLSIERTVVLGNGDLDVEWINYSEEIDLCNTHRIAHLSITNNSEKVIPFSELNANKPGVGIFVTQTDANNIENLMAYRKIDRFLFPGETISFGIAIPQYIGEKDQKYSLSFGIYQTVECEEGVRDMHYAVSSDRKYVVEYK
uniref:hypothetical protein n=1 Tax=Acetatifactor sp. TaxID=1872090 RepID=UPI004055C000